MQRDIIIDGRRDAVRCERPAQAGWHTTVHGTPHQGTPAAVAAASPQSPPWCADCVRWNSDGTIPSASFCAPRLARLPCCSPAVPSSVHTARRVKAAPTPHVPPRLARPPCVKTRRCTASAHRTRLPPAAPGTASLATYIPTPTHIHTHTAVWCGPALPHSPSVPHTPARPLVSSLVWPAECAHPADPPRAAS